MGMVDEIEPLGDDVDKLLPILILLINNYLYINNIIFLLFTDILYNI